MEIFLWASFQKRIRNFECIGKVGFHWKNYTKMSISQPNFYLYIDRFSVLLVYISAATFWTLKSRKSFSKSRNWQKFYHQKAEKKAEGRFRYTTMFKFCFSVVTSNLHIEILYLLFKIKEKIVRQINIIIEKIFF